MELLEELQRARLRELLARLDRIATVDRGHRAGLHLYDHVLFEQYLTILVAWENEVKAAPIRPTLQSAVSAGSAIGQAGTPYLSSGAAALHEVPRGQGRGV